jgi:hypothetical protein
MVNAPKSERQRPFTKSAIAPMARSLAFSGLSLPDSALSGHPVDKRMWKTGMNPYLFTLN